MLDGALLLAEETHQKPKTIGFLHFLKAKALSGQACKVSPSSPPFVRTSTSGIGNRKGMSRPRTRAPQRTF